MRIPRILAAFAVVSTIGLAAPGCGDGDGGGSGKLAIVASIFPIYDLARSVAGDRADVQLLLAPGRGSHNFSPTPSDVKKASTAKIAFIVGLELDEWAAKTIEASASAARIVRLGETVITKGFYTPKLGDAPEAVPSTDAGKEGGPGKKGKKGKGKKTAAPATAAPATVASASAAPEHEEDDHDHGAGPDPHVWMSVPRAMKMVDVIVKELSGVDPANAPAYEANAATLEASLTKLHEDITATTATFTKKAFVTFHGSFGYFADEYGLEIAAVIEPSPGKEPSAAYLKEVLEGLEGKSIGALYTEPQLDPRPAQVLADEAKLELHELDPVGGLEGRETYEALMRFNLAALEKSMK